MIFRTRTKEAPDYKKLYDAKGNLILCYACGKSSLDKRDIIPCDYCTQSWHLDCLDPPLANPPAIGENNQRLRAWRCPLHVEHDIRRINANASDKRRIRARRPKNAKVIDTALIRGHRNNGIIEVADDDSDGTDSEFYGPDDTGVVCKLPTKGLKLDFIDKIKMTRSQEMRTETAAMDVNPSVLYEMDFAQRPFDEQQLALNLAQFANDNQDLDLGGDEVQNLVGTLIAEAPAEVVQSMMGMNEDTLTNLASTAVSDSPPSDGGLSADNRKQLMMLQALIQRKLDFNSTTTS